MSFSNLKFHYIKKSLWLMCLVSEDLELTLNARILHGVKFTQNLWKTVCPAKQEEMENEICGRKVRQ